MGCATPKCAIDTIVALRFDRLPVARSHIDWYLRSGFGRDFDEDGNISSWIRFDHGIRLKLVNQLRRIPVSERKGQKPGFFEFSRGDYEDTDFHFSFGSIDRVDFEFDFDLKECTIWFKDRYEWHPVYDGIYPKMGGDIARSTNCIHAAMVEMKSEGARDYWMTGQATVPLEKLFIP